MAQKSLKNFKQTVMALFTIQETHLHKDSERTHFIQQRCCELMLERKILISPALVRFIFWEFRLLSMYPT